MTIELALLTRVAYRGQEITGPRARGLLALLAGDLRRGSSTARLVEGLWPRELPEHPAKALQVVVSPGQGPAGRRRHRQHAHRLPPVPGRRAGRHRRRPAAGGGGTRRCWWSCCAARRATLDPSAALARYEAYRRSLRDELGTDPGAALQAVQQQLLQGSAPVVRHGVPHEPNPLVGRDDDITAVAGLRRSSRVTSIVGTGGLGKTRLAHAVSRRAEQRVVHFVALAGVAADDVQHHRVAERLAEPGRPDRRLGWRGGHTLPASTLWPWWPRHQQRAGGQVQPGFTVVSHVVGHQPYASYGGEYGD